MLERIIQTESDRVDAARLIQSRAMPFTMRILAGKKRTNPQNALMWKWYADAVRDLAEYTAAEYHGFCKLHYGVPILRAENELFREIFDATVGPINRGPLDYESKVTVMTSPVFKVTSIMNTAQMSQYMDKIQEVFQSKGVKLTQPEETENA